MRRLRAILAWYDQPTSTGTLEGVGNMEFHYFIGHFLSANRLAFTHPRDTFSMRHSCHPNAHPNAARSGAGVATASLASVIPATGPASTGRRRWLVMLA